MALYTELLITPTLLFCCSIIPTFLMYHYVGNVGIEGMLYYCTTQGKYYTTSNGERGVLQYLTGRYQIPVTLEDDGLYYLFVSICCCSGVEVCHHRATSLSSQATGFLSCCYFCPWCNYEQLTWEIHLQHSLKSHWPRYQFKYFSCCKPVWIKLPVIFSKIYSETNTFQVTITDFYGVFRVTGPLYSR